MIARYVHLLDLVPHDHHETGNRVPHQRNGGVRNPLNSTRSERFLGPDSDQFVRYMPEMPVPPTVVPDRRHHLGVTGNSRPHDHSHAASVNEPRSLAHEGELAMATGLVKTDDPCFSWGDSIVEAVSETTDRLVRWRGIDFVVRRTTARA